jgi:hypothetical protein
MLDHIGHLSMRRIEHSDIREMLVRTAAVRQHERIEDECHYSRTTFGDRPVKCEEIRVERDGRLGLPRPRKRKGAEECDG